MKVSLNTIRGLNNRYQTTSDFKIKDDELVAKISAQLGAVDEAIKLGEKYQGIVVVKVVSCDKHPDADKLSLCKVDDRGNTPDVKRDDQGLVQVVCGAPNVKAGLLAAWLPPGTIVPVTYGTAPLVLEAREIRGQVSNGMLASPKELALGDSHEGILELPDSLASGDDFAEKVGLKDELILDIENKMFTHRPDCFGFLGVARELAGIQGQAFKSPDWYVAPPEFPDADETLPLSVKNEVPELAPRFMAITMSGVKVGPSPLWLQVYLSEIGQKSVNNIVDYTNFFMHETAQPLHAYDYDKVKSLSGSQAAIVVRNPKPGEKIKLLNGKEIEPRSEAVVIATDQQAIGLGGVMGGSETEVDYKTTNIILECANFDMYSIRRTSMAHGLFTDAVTRFTKGQSPLQNPAVLAKIVNEIISFANGQLAGKVIDDNHLDETTMQRNTIHPPVKLSKTFINDRLGLELSVDDMKRLLENVEFKVETSTDDLTVTAPFWRTDIELREDVVEEIGRLYGYDKLPLELPKRDLTPATQDKMLQLKARIRDQLSRSGANEVLTYSFVHSDLLTKVGQDPAQAFQIANALSPELQYYRISLMPSLLEKIHANIKAGYDQFALFELGKTHSLDQKDDENLPAEFEFTALVVTANDKLRPAGAAYYQAKRYLEQLVGADKLEFKPVVSDMQHYPVVQPYDLNRTALVSIKDGPFLGIIGEFKASVRQALKLPRFTAGFEIDTSVLQPILAAGSSYRVLSRFPSVKQDITLSVPSKTTYQELKQKIDQALQDHAPEDTQFLLEPIDNYQPSDSDNRHFTFRVTIAALNRTLTDKEVSHFLDAVTQEVGAERV